MAQSASIKVAQKARNTMFGCCVFVNIANNSSKFAKGYSSVLPFSSYRDSRSYNQGYGAPPPYGRDAAPPRSGGHRSYPSDSRQDSSWRSSPAQNSAAVGGSWGPMLPRTDMPPNPPYRNEGGSQRNLPPSRPRGSYPSSGSSSYSSYGRY